VITESGRDAVPAAGLGRAWPAGGLKHRPDGTIRIVPIPPVLVRLLRQHLDRYGPAPGGRLFRGAWGGMLSESIYGRAWPARPRTPPSRPRWPPRQEHRADLAAQRKTARAEKALAAAEAGRDQIPANYPPARSAPEARLALLRTGWRGLQQLRRDWRCGVRAGRS
jgi:hypothetical protein